MKNLAVYRQILVGNRWRGLTRPRGSFVAFLIPLLLIVSLTACSSASTPTPTAPQAGGALPTPTQQETIKSGGALRVALPANVLGMDPAFSLNTADIISTLQLYDNLVLRQPDGSFRPMLAESWTHNDELTEWTFHLRKGVKFQNGKDFEAEDVVFTFNRLLDPATGSPGRTSVEFIKEVIADDPDTVRFVLKGPNAFVLSGLTIYQARILPANVDVSRLQNESFGTGPFSLVEFRPGERTIMKRNPDYWDSPRPYLDELVFFYMSEPETRVEALKDGSVDVVFPLEPTSLRALEGVPGVRVDEKASAAYLNLAMDTRVPPFDNKLVRKAVQLATDREAIRKVANLGRGAIANDHPIPPSDPAYWKDQTITPYDPQKARDLLAQAGHPSGIDLTLHTSTVEPGMTEMAVAFKESAAPAGIRVTIIREPEDAYWARVWMAEPFTTVTWNGREPDEALTVVYMSSAEWNEAYYKDPELDALIIQARRQVDNAERNATYAEIQRKLIDQATRIITVFRPILVGVRTNVMGVEAHPNNWLILSEAWLNR
ncbi:MAG: ABC transporter substrate-binding protein [Chloroflexi bacterium]|nr:ABC transporter substrate-binding protein [Chloroflexota bacterium]